MTLGRVLETKETLDRQGRGTIPCAATKTSAIRESFVAYSDTQLFINGTWRPSHSGRTIDVLNPATEETIGTVAHADRSDLDEALAAAASGFKVWRAVSAFDRCKIMRKAAAIMRERNDEIAPLLTMEQGKTLAEAKMEAMAAADVIEWFAEEAKRAYGRVIPARGPGIYQLAIKERSARSPRSRHGISRSTRWCANCPQHWRRAARSSSRRRRKRRLRRRS
jgi:hypothetical protein